MMTRRKLLVLLGAGTLSAPLASMAQYEPKKVYRVGILAFGTAASGGHLFAAFTQALAELGYVEGKNILIERRFADGNVDRLQTLAADLAQQRVNVIFAPTTITVEAAKKVAGTIPIVFAATADPVGSGFIASLARPSGNITGMSSISPELSAKRLQLLQEAFVKISRVAIIVSGESADAVQVSEVQRAAKGLGMDVLAVPTRGADDLEQGSALLRRWRADSMYVVESPTNFLNRKLLTEFAAKLRLPAIYATRDYAESGGLLSYGTDYESNYRRAAYYVDRILKGAKPGELPVEQPTRFELVINMKTAKALGLTIPQTILVRADRVIE